MQLTPDLFEIAVMLQPLQLPPGNRWYEYNPGNFQAVEKLEQQIRLI